jgi:hypothetical protein
MGRKVGAQTPLKTALRVRYLGAVAPCKKILLMPVSKVVDEKRITEKGGVKNANSMFFKSPPTFNIAVFGVKISANIFGPWDRCYYFTNIFAKTF